MISLDKLQMHISDLGNTYTIVVVSSDDVTMNADLTGLAVDYLWIGDSAGGTTDSIGKPIVDLGLVHTAQVTITDEFGYSVVLSISLN